MRIDRAVFHDALKELARVASPKAVLPVQRSVFIEAQAGQVTLRATDLDRHLTCQLQAEGEIIACLPAKLLANLIKPERKADKGDVVIEPAGEHRFSVTLDGLATKLHGIDPAEFPGGLDQDEWQLVAMWPSKPLMQALAYVLPATSSDETRPNLGGVHFAGDHLESTDGHRLHRMPLPAPLAEPILVPAHSAMTLKRILADADQVILARSGDVLRVKAGCWQLDTRQLEGQFPDTDQVVPDQDATTTKLTVETAVFSKALSRLGRLSAGKAVKFVVNGAVELSAWDVEVGDATTSVPTITNNHSGDDLVVGFNRAYLQDALATRDDSVEIAFTDAMGPLRIDASDRLAVVMPMRV